MKSKHALYLSAALVLLAAAFASRTARAEYTAPDSRVPSPRYEATNSASFPNGFHISSFFDVFTEISRVPPPAPGASSTLSFFDIFTELSLDNGGPPTTFHPGGPAEMQLNGLPPGDPGTRTFDTEMLSMNLSGGNLPAGVMIRESPSRPSLGQTRITDIGGGQYHVDSFFDIFTDLSLDGGQTWTPSDGSMHLQGTPEPSTFVLAAMGLVACTAMAIRRARRGH